MNVILPRQQVIDLHRNLQRECVQKLNGCKLGYAVAKTMKACKAEIDAVQKALKAPSILDEYDQARIELCLQHAEKDAAGQPVMRQAPGGRQEYVVADRPAFEAALATLAAEKFPTLAAVRQKFDQDVQAFLGEPVGLAVHGIRLSDIPGGASVEAMTILADLIEEE